MIEKYIIEKLTEDQVTLSKLTYIEYNGELVQLGPLWMASFENDRLSRDYIRIFPEPQVNAIFCVWGDEPTVDLDAK